MPWPSSSDIFDRLWDPQTAFDDPELTDPNVDYVEDPSGAPWVSTGRFAIVGQLINQQTNKKYAVRAFKAAVTTQQQIYADISQFIEDSKQQNPAVDLTFISGFTYLDHGICVPGVDPMREWFPIIKMPWADGLTVDAYIQTLIDNGRQGELETLAQVHRLQCTVQETYEFCHGDKQHENFIIIETPPSGVSLIWIDLDDMFVPSRVGQSSYGVGKPAYQHPDRTGADFCAEIDRYSNIMMYGSFKAMKERPDLWTTYHGDENLIIPEEAIKDHSHAIWAQLDAMSDPEVVLCAKALRAYSLLAITDVPALEDLLTGVVQVPTLTAPRPRPVVPTTSQPRITPTTSVPHTPPPPAIPRISLPATSVQFTATRVGQDSTGTFIIQNSGTGDLHVTAVSVVSGPFTVAPLTSTTVTPLGSVTVTVNFTPTARGQAAGSVEVRSDDPNNMVLIVNLSGRGLAPEISISWPGQPGPLDFCQVRVGSASAPRSITIQNIGDADLGNISITGPANVTVGQYAATLAAGAVQDVELVFTPAAEGIVQGQIQITSDDPVSRSLTIALTGEGFVPPPVKKCLRCGDINPQTAAWCRCGNYLRNWRNYELLRP